MTARKDFVARVRRRAIELLIADDQLDLHAAERKAVKELKEIARLQSRSLDAIEHLRSPLKREQLSRARARLGAVLSNMAARMAIAASIIPRALTTPASTAEAPVADGGERIPPDERNPLAPATAEPEPPSDVLLIFAGHAGGAPLIPDSEYPPALQSIPTQNWRASIGANRRRGSS